MDVATSHDLEAHPEMLDGHRLWLHVGHDEYWSWGMRDALDAFVAGGGNTAIFSGNTCFWQIRFEDDGRAMTCFKYRADPEDPVLGTADERFLSGIWSDRRVGRPETSTIGLTFTRGGYSRYGLGAPRASGGYTVARPDHWAFEGTDLRYGDKFGERDAIVAYEVDGCAFTMRDGEPVPTHEDGAPDASRSWPPRPRGCGLSTSSRAATRTSPASWSTWRRRCSATRRPDNVERIANNHAVMATFTRPGGGTVFNAGVIDWAFGLKHGDPDVERITRNVLDRLGER